MACVAPVGLVLTTSEARQNRHDVLSTTIYDANAVSIHVAERLGFRPFGHAAHRGSALLLFQRIRSTTDA
jgi:hypothetical protein